MTVSFHILRLAFLLVITGVVTAGGGLALRFAFPLAWPRFLRRLWLAVFAATAASLTIWTLGRIGHVDVVVRAGAFVAALLLTAPAAVFVTAPVWALLAGLVRASPVPHDPKRRAFLGRAVAVLPASATLAGPVGVVAAGAAPVLRHVEVRSRLIPASLDGFTILQISDVHLGTFVDVDQVRKVVEAARAHKPDLVALTGDIADDYDMLGPALDAVLTLAPPHGTFAIVGNHEIYRGRARAQAIIEGRGVRWLCNDGVVVDGRFFLGGTDDPAGVPGKPRPFYERSVRAALERCPADMCKVVLAHRPEAFDVTAEHGVALTLSGHTHGGQIAWFGRSVFEGIVPLKYMLGLYDKGDSVQFTTAGLGHWFPFRFNCPAEAALVTLRSA